MTTKRIKRLRSKRFTTQLINTIINLNSIPRHILELVENAKEEVRYLLFRDHLSLAALHLTRLSLLSLLRVGISVMILQVLMEIEISAEWVKWL